MASTRSNNAWAMKLMLPSDEITGYFHELLPAPQESIIPFVITYWREPHRAETDAVILPARQKRPHQLSFNSVLYHHANAVYTARSIWSATIIAQRIQWTLTPVKDAKTFPKALRGDSRIRRSGCREDLTYPGLVVNQVARLRSYPP